MSRPHDLRRSLGVFDVHQFTLADTRAPASGLVPGAAAFHDLRPEWKGAALNRLCLMHTACAVREKLALCMLRHAESPRILCAVYVASFEDSHRHMDEPGKPRNILFSQIDEALLFAAFGTPGLTPEPHCFRYSAGSINAESGTAAAEKPDESIVISRSHPPVSGAAPAA
jgi:hypothetical protein